MSQDLLRKNLYDITQNVIEYLRFLKEMGVTSINSAREYSDSHFTKDDLLVKTSEIASLPISENSNIGDVEMKSTSTKQSLFDLLGETNKNDIDTLPIHDTSLQDIRDDMGDCQRCKLGATRKNLVFGDGNPNADLVFVGEAPGADEDETGLPFVGRAGQLLTKIIEAIGMNRKDVYICNVIKSRPPGNRPPEKDEIEACSGFLHRQLAVIKPKVIVSLGAPAAFTLLGSNKLGKISDIRGKFYDYRGTPLMVTFHPAYLLRSPDKKREVWEDMKQVRNLLSSSKK